MKILLTGGAGFIGSHTLIELTEAGHEAVVVDNLDNSSPISLKRVAKIIGKDVPFYKVDTSIKFVLVKYFLQAFAVANINLIKRNVFTNDFCNTL